LKRDLKFEVTYSHPIEKVWRAITDSRAMEAWLMPNGFEPRVGHKFQFRSKPQPGWNGISDCEVLEVSPPHRLVYTWRGGPIDTLLTITLEKVQDGTLLRLVHSGFRGFKALLVSLVMGGGWKGIVHRRLPAVLARLDDNGNLRPAAGNGGAKQCA
jgi:uncharacterized protein YndB with AHSA1/START domain